MKNIFVLLCCCLFWQFSYGQKPLEDTSKEIITQSLPTVRLLSNATLRFENSASVYLKWEADVKAEKYQITYTNGKSAYTVETSQKELLIDNLPLDTEFSWKVSASGTDDKFISDQGVFSTAAQSEPIAVSGALYKQLTRWFMDEKSLIPFCDYLDQLQGINKMEILSFVQAYTFDNAAFVKGKEGDHLSAWYPPALKGKPEDCYQPPNPPNPPATKCRCRVITRGTNLATPTSEIDVQSGVIRPRVEQFIHRDGNNRTYVDRFEAGAAKFVSLRQNQGGGSVDFSSSNMQGGDDSANSTTQASELQFFLGCTNGSTNLPSQCGCERPLYVRYEYTTNLRVRAETGGCPWSKAAAAQAEDMAFVVAYNERDNEMTALGAGQAGVSRSCESNWNPDFWIELLDVLNPVALFLASGDSVPSADQLNQFTEELQDLIGTPFTLRSGECGITNESAVLIDSSATLTLRPNHPLRIGMFSAYYVRTRAYGCWRTDAAIASDYFLAGVVESEQTEDPECCSDKFGNYILGSLSHPPEGDVHVDAINSIQDRQNEVGAWLATFGDWEGLQTLPGNGIIDLDREFDLLTGPSCSRNSTGNRAISDGFVPSATMTTPVNPIRFFPTPTNDRLTISIQAEEISSGLIRFTDLNGRMIDEVKLDELAIGDNTIQISTSEWIPGGYIASVVINEEVRYFKLMKQ